MEINYYFGAPVLEIATSLIAFAAVISMIPTLFSSFGARVCRPSWKPQRPELDERERPVVARAHAASFRILLAGLLLVFLYGWGSMNWGWWLPRTPEDLELLF